MEKLLVELFQNNYIILLILVVSSSLFGISMKLADVFNEHGVAEFFPGAKILSGFIWGLLGVLLIMLNKDVGVAIMAMILAYIARMRIDYQNHAIGSVMVMIGFLLFGNFEIVTFFFFFSFFLIFGSVKDYFQYYSSNKKITLKNNFLYNSLIWFYPVSSFIYGILYGRWEAFFSLTLFNLSYALVKIYYQKRL